ncbi:helix-turn-helix domain-containing protein [Chitinophaga sp. GbtcB8]|uniref:helix-turn-helix domain-containing protein n=1 Tax=Chitinophaga sp. GbtcB8 TaxID=2824753 RepID=UPI0034CFD0D2
MFPKRFSAGKAVITQKDNFSANIFHRFTSVEESKDILLTLGDNIKALRKLKGLTQVDMETRTGIDAGDLSRIESGQVNLTFIKLVKLAAALGVELNELFTMKNK